MNTTIRTDQLKDDLALARSSLRSAQKSKLHKTKYPFTASGIYALAHEVYVSSIRILESCSMIYTRCARFWIVYFCFINIYKFNPRAFNQNFYFGFKTYASDQNWRKGRIEWISIFPSFEQIFRKKLDLYCVGDISLFDQQFENQVSWEYPVCIAFHVSVFNHYFNSDLRIYASEKLEKRKQLIWGISSFHILYKDSQRKTRFVLRVINVSTPQ